MVAWYDNVPSRAQLQYLKNLGYAGKSPQAQAEASAAIEEMLSSGSTAATWEAILEERRERAEFFGDHREYDFDDFDDFDDDERPRRARPSGIGYLFALVYLVSLMLIALLLTLASVVAGFFWVLSRLISAVEQAALLVAGALVFVFSRLDLIGDRTIPVAVATGRDQVLPWMGPRDWRSMALGCSAQFTSGVRRVDLFLAAAGRNRPLSLLDLRLATTAAAFVAVVVVLSLVR